MVFFKACCPEMSDKTYNYLIYNESEVAQLCLTLATPRPVACQAPLSMGFPRQEYGSGLTFPSPGDLPDTGIKPRSPALQADSLPTKLQGKIFYM